MGNFHLIKIPKNNYQAIAKILTIALLMLLYLGNNTATAQQSSLNIKGKVVSGADNKPITGVSIWVAENTSIGASTDFDGNFEISVPANSTLKFAFVGYTTQSVVITTQTHLDIKMPAENITLEDVVVMGYTTMKRKDLTGAVASVNSKQIERIPAYDIRSSLVGVPGVVLQDGNIRIRGNRSVNAKNEPLIILDGVQYNETYASINPNDIETMDILKDASTTSIYGAQGANGVIVITTKQAKEGKTIVNYDAFAGWGKINKRNFRPMNANEYVDFRREAYRASGTWHDESDDSKVFFGSEIPNIGKMDEDWLGKYWNKSRFWTSQTVTISAASPKTAYKIAFNYKNEESRYKGARNDKLYLTTDINHKVFDYLKVGVSNRMYYYSGKDKPDPFGGLLTMSPLTPIYKEDGSYNITPTGDPYVRNPFLNENDDAYKDQTEEWKIFLRMYLDIDFGKGLTFHTNFMYNPAFSARGYYYDDRSVGHQDARNVAGVHNNRKADWVWNNILSYKKTFGDIHSIDLTAVYEMRNSETVNTSASGKAQEVPSYLWYNMSRLTDSKSISSGFVRSQMISYVARAHYTLMDRYMFTASLRQDGASQLTKSERWDLFPSFGAAWTISEENFMKDISYINNLKLRASYGVTGNYSVEPYSTRGRLYGTFLTLYNDNGEIHYPGLEADIRPTPNLKWERNKMLNIGVDFAFLNNRIQGTIDYYDSKGFNLLYQVRLPYTSGFNRAWENVGDTRNRGWEVGLNTIPVQTKEFTLGVNLTYYRNKEELVRLQDPTLKRDIDNGFFVGYPVKAVHFDHKQLGIWQENETDLAAIYGQKPGEVKVLDRDGNGKIDGDDRTILGTKRPDWVGSLQLTASWKNFDFAMDCYGEFGAMVHDGYSTGTWAGELGRWNTVKVDYWTPEKPNNKHPRPIRGQTIKYINTIGYHKNDYFMIRNITLGYTVPEKLMGKIIKRARFYATVTEPYKHMKFQQEGGLTFNESFYILGINVQF